MPSPTSHQSRRAIAATALVLTGLACARGGQRRAVPEATTTTAHASPDDAARASAPSGMSSSAWLSLLPDGEEKRRFVLDCTGCHQFDAQVARPGGARRTE